LDGSVRRGVTFEEVEKNKESCKISKSRDPIIRQRIQDFIRRHSVSKVDALEVVNSQDGGENVLLDSVPIADDFKDTSIMFADISSFTYWSSQHSPIEVFTLLESLFYEFDSIANDMDVYKLSTVGDCYIACAGVPHPQNDHAIVLTQFAERCRQKANELLVRLSPKLDTDDLGIRIGIHSGPVTAGVLRGDTPRFDLFGDTINTAARIESTGKPNCIHLSEQTAQLIIQGGMGDWLIPREDGVKAKGKGELKTYWLRGAEDVDPQDMV
jgi:class 3 adenylate cyclase